MRTFKDYLVEGDLDSDDNYIRFKVYTSTARTQRNMGLIKEALKNITGSKFRIKIYPSKEARALCGMLYLNGNPIDVNDFFTAGQDAMRTVTFKDVPTLTSDWTGPPLVISGNLLGRVNSLETRIWRADKIDTQTLVKNLSTEGIRFEGVSKPFGLLWLLQIKGLKRADGLRFNSQPPVGKAFSIVKKHLAGRKDILACQEELIDAGLEEYAEL